MSLYVLDTDVLIGKMDQIIQTPVGCRFLSISFHLPRFREFRLNLEVAYRVR